MEQKQVEQFKAWFDNYVATFYGDDQYINANLKLKEDHSRRTCDEMLYLANELHLPENQSRIAEVIALFHDIGRFKQFVEYSTYHDPRSTDHCRLGLQVIRQTNVLDGVDPAETELIEKAIEYHGLKELPPALNGQCLLFSKLIRDADKLDIFYVVIENCKKYKANPEEFNLEIELPDEPGYTPEVLESVLKGWHIEYSRLRTLNDMKLMQLGWVYDVNFTPTLKRIKNRGFLDMILDFLPSTEDIEKVRKKVFDYVDSRINSA